MERLETEKVSYNSVIYWANALRSKYLNLCLCLAAGQDDPESEDEVYEVVDLTEYARRHQWWSRVFGNNSGPIAEKYSVATQLMMGGVTGW